MKKLLVISAILAFTALLSSCKPEEGKDPEVSPNKLEFSREGGSKTFQLVAGADWRIVINNQDTNVKVSPMSGGVGTHEITVTLSENRTFAEYNGALTVNQTVDKKTSRVTIVQVKTQAPSIGSITPFTIDGGKKEVTISAQWNWALIDTTEVFPTWLSMDIKRDSGVNGQPVTTKVTLTAQPLPESSPTRTHTLFFRIDKGQWSERVMSLEIEQLNEILDEFEGDWIANQWKSVQVGNDYVDMFTSDEVFFVQYDEVSAFWNMLGDWTDRNDNAIYKFQEFDAATFKIKGELAYTAEDLTNFPELQDFNRAIVATGERSGIPAGRLLLASSTDPAGVEVPYYTTIGMDTRDGYLSYWITGWVNEDDHSQGAYTSGIPALVKLNEEGRLEVCDPWHPQGTINGFWYSNELPDGTTEWIAVSSVIWVMADLTALGEVNENGDGWFALGNASLQMPLFFRPDDLEGRRTGDILPDPDYPKPTSKASKYSTGKKLSAKAQIAPKKYKVIGFSR
jgi:hypothetical protein